MNDTIKSALWPQFEAVVHDAEEVGGGHALEISDANIPNSRADLQWIFWKVKEDIISAETNEATELLVAPILSAALRKIIRIYPVTMHQLIEEPELVAEKKARVDALNAAIESSPMYEQWKPFAQRIAEHGKMFGYSIEPESMDIAALSPVLLNAATFVEKGIIRKFYTGADCTDKVRVYWNMPVFQSNAEFLDSFRHIKSGNCIALALIEETIGGCCDSFDEWKLGRKSELWNNHIVRDNGSKDDVFNGYILFGIKRGENIWTLGKNENGEYQSAGIYRNKSFYAYGRRASYLPYQVKFQSDSIEKSMALTVRGRGTYDLTKILDEEQAVWLPFVLSTIENAFFNAQMPDNEPLYICPSSVVIEKTLRAPENELSIITNMPMPNVFQMPEGMERDTVGEEILKCLDITAEDLADIPLYFSTNSSPIPREKLQAEVWARCRTALCVLASRKLKEDYAAIEDDSVLGTPYRGINEPRKFTGDYVRMIEANTDAILSMLGDKDSPIHEITQITVNGENGTTSIEDGKIRKYSRNARLFIGIESGKRPPVAIRIAPRDGHDIALLTGVPYENLNWRYRTWIANSGGYSYRHRRSTDDADINIYDRKKVDPLFLLESPYDKQRLLVCIAMSKKAYKQYIQKKE